jgi:hypothetical protein
MNTLNKKLILITAMVMLLVVGCRTADAENKSELNTATPKHIQELIDKYGLEGVHSDTVIKEEIYLEGDAGLEFLLNDTEFAAQVSELLKQAISVYPNPTSGSVTVELKSGAASTSTNNTSTNISVNPDVEDITLDLYYMVPP